MNDRLPRRFRTAALASMLLSGAIATAEAAPVAIDFTFDDGTNFVNPGLGSGSVLPAEITGADSAWSVLDGTVENLNGQGGTGRAIAARSWNDGNAFKFALNVASGFKLSLTQISFFEQGSNGGQGLGPTDWKLSINGSDVTALRPATRGNPGATQLIDTGLPSALTGTVEFMIFATGAANSPGASNAANATWRIDNFQLTGDVAPVPVPAAAWLLGSGVIALAARRRRTG